MSLYTTIRSLFVTRRLGSVDAATTMKDNPAKPSQFFLPPRLLVCLLAAEAVLLIWERLQIFPFNHLDWTIPIALIAILFDLVLLLAWLRVTPLHVALALLALEAILAIYECFRFRTCAFNEQKGWTVLIALAVVAATFALLGLWLIFALVFRLRFQYSLRTLLLFVLCVTFPCCWFATERHQAREQERIVDNIVRQGGGLTYGYQVDHLGESYWQTDSPPTTPLYLRRVLGEFFFTDVVGVDFGRKVDLRCLEGLRHLRWLYLYYDVTDEGLEPLERLTGLELLVVVSPRVTDAGLEHLERLSRLKLLSMEQTAVSDKGIDRLRRIIPRCKVNR